jgi:hypothetical protein
VSTLAAFLEKEA